MKVFYSETLNNDWQLERNLNLWRRISRRISDLVVRQKVETWRKMMPVRIKAAFWNHESLICRKKVSFGWNKWYSCPLVRLGKRHTWYLLIIWQGTSWLRWFFFWRSSASPYTLEKNIHLTPKLLCSAFLRISALPKWSTWENSASLKGKSNKKNN